MAEFMTGNGGVYAGDNSCLATTDAGNSFAGQIVIKPISE